MSTVRTWADGFGRWYAEVPAGDPTPYDTAQEAIGHELDIRGDRGPDFVPVLECHYMPYDPDGSTLVYREAWDQ